MKKQYYRVVQFDDYYAINLCDIVGLPFKEVTGSYHVFKARLMGLSYPDFLRLARDTYGAELKGREGFIIEIFMDNKKANILCAELNKRIGEVI